jgi:hypothetical protein
MSDQVTERYGDVEVIAPGDHAAFANVVSEMQRYMRHIDVFDAIGHCDVRFVNSSEMFSRVLRRIESNGSSAGVSSSRNITNRAVICLDLVGVYFFERFTENMFASQRALWEYIEGSLTGTIGAVDHEGFMSADSTFLAILNAPTDYLASQHGELLSKIRNTPDDFWERSMLDILGKLRNSVLNWLNDGPPFKANYEELAGLVYRTIARFTLGHELGHCIRDNRASVPYWGQKVAALKPILSEADPAADTELFSDCVAIDYTLYQFRYSEPVRYDARIIVAILLVIIHLTDSMSLGAQIADQSETQREFYSGRHRINYLRSLIEAREPWIDIDSDKLLVSTMSMDMDLSDLAVALSFNMQAIIDAISDRAEIRRKEKSHTYTATVRAFGSRLRR